MRAVYAMGLAACVTGAILACGSSYGDATDAPEDDASADAAVDGGIDAFEEPPVTFDAGDAGDADANGDMVEIVVTASTHFLIDRTEVTAEQFAEFKIEGDAGFASIKGCGNKTAIGPDPTCMSTAVIANNQPVRCVDWCDAKAYCAYVGKRLCGKINGGPTTVLEQQDPATSQWTRACAGNNVSAQRYSYGETVDASACNVQREGGVGNAVPVATTPTCEGPEPGLFDMSGNVEEWVDACSGGDGGLNQDCVSMGGAWPFAPRTCGTVSTAARGTTMQGLGFRCCKDL